VSNGVRKGEIVDVEAAREAIHTAVTEAENSAGVEIRAVYASVTGGHIRSFNNHGVLPILNDDSVISPEDVENVLRSARAVSLPLEHAPVHTVKRAFYVDGQKGIENPVGMLGSRLEVDVHVIHGVRTRLQNTLRAIKSVPLDIKGVVFNPLASALAILTTQHKELGALVIDIGGGTTDYVVYTGGTIRHSGVLAVGGDHVSNDLAVGLKIPINKAENLKVEHGVVPADDSMKGQAITLKREVGLPERDISKEVLCRIMELRLEEILQLVKTDVEKQGLLGSLGAGVFLTGGCARTRGIQTLAERVFGVPVNIGVSGTVSGVQSALDSPECAAAIGIVKFGSLTEAQQPQRPKGFTAKLMGLMRLLVMLFFGFWFKG
jgi:cell division protein FtsA